MNDIDIVNAALVQLGCEKIVALDDSTAEGRIAGPLYPITRDAMLAQRQWTFAKTRVALALSNTPPVFGFANAYALPNDIITVIRVWFADGRTLVADYIREGGYVLTNAEAPVFAEILRKVPESAFHPLFTKALVAQLAADMAIPLTENRSLADSWETKAVNRLQEAALQDGKQGTNETVTLPAMPGRRSHTRNSGRF